MARELPPGIELHRNKYRVRKWLNGVRVRRSFDTLPEAEAYLALLTKDAEEARAIELARITGAATVMDVVRLWWLGPLIDGEHQGGHRRRVAARTARDYQQYIDTYISRIGGESAQSYARNPGLLKLFYDSLPNRMAWHVHGVLRLAFREAVTRGLMERNPCSVEKPRRRKRTRRLVPSREEAEKIVAAAEEEHPQWGLFVYLTSTLGTRCGETCALRTEDFDEANGVVHIVRAVSKAAARPILKDPKKGEPRSLDIDDPAFWDYVRPFLGAAGFLFPGYHRDAPHKGPGATEKPWHPDHAQARFREMVRRLGLPAFTLHSLRHFAATQLLIEGQPINQVAEFLGHSPQQTLSLYGRHLDRDAMRRVGRAAASLVPRGLPPEGRVTPPDAPGAAQPPERCPKAPPMNHERAEQAVLELARAGPVTNAGIRQHTSLTRRQVSKVLDRLVARGALQRVGGGRDTRYVLRGRPSSQGEDVQSVHEDHERE